DAVAKRAQDARLANAGLADEDHGGTLVERFEEHVDNDELRGWQPQLSVGNLLRERCVLAAEVREIGGGAHLSPPRRRCAAARGRRADRATHRPDRTASWSPVWWPAASGASYRRRRRRRDAACNADHRARRPALRCRSYRQRR